MDSYRDHPSDFDLPASSEAPPQQVDVAAAIGTDERRMHVRAYNYWVSLLEGRDFPSIEDLEPEDVKDFAANSVLLDFTCGRDNPALPYVGTAIRDECELDDDVRTISDVPSRSLLSRLTDHYMQIIANRAPVGFEAEFDNPRGDAICYRGILMPFSSDGEAIDFIYGVINWKRVGGEDQELVSEPASAAEQPAQLRAEAEPEPEPESELERFEDVADQPQLTETMPEPAELHPTDIAPLEQAAPPEAAGADGALDQLHPAPPHFAWEDGPLADAESDELPEIALDENAGLADRLSAARETAESVNVGEGRTRVALYRALALAYDFALAAQENPEEYAELLDESGVKAQARAPMTPIVKLVFGVDYDKARLTEFAAALSYAFRQEVARCAFGDFIDKQQGGLKALVAAERQARRPEAKPDTKTEVARARLRMAPPISLADVRPDEEFAIVLTRRGADGTHEPVAVVDDAALVERAIRRAA